MNGACCAPCRHPEARGGWEESDHDMGGEEQYLRGVKRKTVDGGEGGAEEGERLSSLVVCVIQSPRAVSHEPRRSAGRWPADDAAAGACKYKPQSEWTVGRRFSRVVGENKVDNLGKGTEDLSLQHCFQSSK